MLQISLKCCLIHITIIILRYILYLVYLCPALGLFLSHLYNIFFIFSLIFIVINLYNVIKRDALAFCTFFKIPPFIFG